MQMNPTVKTKTGQCEAAFPYLTLNYLSGGGRGGGGKLQDV